MTHRSTHHRGFRPGFTLIELLIVTVIIAILASVAIPHFTKLRERAARRAMVSDLRNLAGAQETHFSTAQTYSTDPGELGFNGTAGVTLVIVEATPTGWSARTTRPGVSGDCTLIVGDAAPLNPADASGRIRCTE